MKVFLSALENSSTMNGQPIAKYLVDSGIEMKWNLMSYYYIRKKRDLANYIKAHSEQVLIDSGAHSFQKGKKVDWIEYTKEYAEFIRQYDDDKVVGFFEMDVDKVIGYDKVLELRKILERASDKIIPVWHDSRGIAEYKKMCQDYAGKVVAFSGFRGMDIKDHQYLMFLKYAREYGCKVHCLGMTRKDILDKVPFDYTDSSSWVQQSIFGRIGNKGKVTRDFSKTQREVVFKENYLLGMEMQKKYYQKWRKVCKD